MFLDFRPLLCTMFLVYLVIGALQMFFDDDDDDMMLGPSCLLHMCE